MNIRELLDFIDAEIEKAKKQWESAIDSYEAGSATGRMRAYRQIKEKIQEGE